MEIVPTRYDDLDRASSLQVGDQIVIIRGGLFYRFDRELATKADIPAPIEAATSPPGTLVGGQSGTVGTSTRYAREDHTHTLPSSAAGPNNGKLTVKQSNKTVIEFSANQSSNVDVTIDGIPLGVICMWSGFLANIPKGWSLCNGQTVNSIVTPDLRGRFVVGTGHNGTASNGAPSAVLDDAWDSSYAQTANMSVRRGGFRRVQLEIKELPKHNHTYNNIFNKLTANAADVAISINGQAARATVTNMDTNVGNGEIQVGNMNIAAGNAQWRDATMQSVGNDEPHENRPPWMALAYIMKTGND